MLRGISRAMAEEGAGARMQGAPGFLPSRRTEPVTVDSQTLSGNP